MRTVVTCIFTSLIAICLAIPSRAIGQSAEARNPFAKATNPSSIANMSELNFDVVSIHKNNGDDAPSGFITDGYKAVGMPLWRTIAYAYFPVRMRDPNWIRNAPSWVFDEKYDIIAKIAFEDAVAWQKLRKKPSSEENPELQSMFEKLLEDRCHLKTHRTASEVDGYFLEIDRGLKISAGKPDETPPPDAIMRDDGGTVTYFEKEGSHGWTFQNASVRLLLSFLSLFSGLPIRDKTNLDARYDFTLEIPDQNSTGSELQSEGVSDDFALVQVALKGLGFKLNRSKVPLSLVVIDHIERPTAN
jgi:uncharacterized protein (TIGR03435 family)